MVCIVVHISFFYALYRACAKERLEVVQCLLSRSSSEPLPNLSGNESPIHIACERGNHKIVQALLDHSPRLMFATHHEGETPLHMACTKGDLELVRAICSRIRTYVSSAGVKEGETLPPDIRDKAGCTPFFIACSNGHIQILREFCQLKEDLGKEMTLNVNSAQHDTNRTPLHVAVTNGNLETVKLLLTLEDTDKNVEARPSSTTHELLLRNIETKRHGRLLLPHERDDFYFSQNKSLSRSPTDVPLGLSPSPSLPHYPLPGGTFGSVGAGVGGGTFGSVGAGVGGGTFGSVGCGGGGYLAPANTTGYSTAHEETDTSYPANVHSASTTLSNFTVPVPPRKFPSPRNPKKVFSNARTRASTQGSEIDGDEGDDRALGIFLNQREELVVGKRDRTGGIIFGQLKLSPLAEACALGHNEVAEELLKYGGHDSSGLACRIAYLVQEYDLMQHMLSRCCSVLRREKLGHGSSSTGEKKGTQGEPGLRLTWNAKKLPEVRGEWFSDSAMYYVDRSRGAERETEEEEEVTSEAQANLCRVGPLKLRQLTPAEMPIRELHLARNNLKSLPVEIFQLEHLTDLQLHQNRIIELPEESEGKGWRCTRLEQINLSQNHLLRLPACLWMLPVLRKIGVSHNKISTFAESDIPRGELSPCLTSLDLNHNFIGPSLPDFIFQFPSLEKVLLSKNKLQKLPDTLWLCTTLQELNVSSNELTSLPLCEPDMEGVCPENGMGTGPTIFQQSDMILTGVVQVKPTSANPYAKQKSSIYRSIKPSGGELSWVNYCVVNTETYDYSQLKKLDLSKNRLSRFPEALPCLAPNLTELIISHNPIDFIDIQYVPESIKKLVCRYCEIKFVGNVIGADEFKQAIRVCRCPVDTYRGNACQHRNHPRLDHLTTFDLTRNKIQHFQLIHHSQQSQRTGKDPGHQPIEKAFQSSLSSLELLYPALENLDLSHNDLRDLFNPNIGHQTHLKSIKLGHNPELERIPYEFSSLKKSKDFTELDMSGLPKLHKPPAEYQTAELSHVLTYMRSCLKE